jgi:hypothetical protein
MERRVITPRDEKILSTAAGAVKVPSPQIPKEDDYTQKLLKYIPAEIVAAFIAIDGVIKSVTNPSIVAQWVILGVLFLATVAYTWRASEKPGLPLAIDQICISSIAFFIWVFTLGGPFASLSWYMSYYGTIALILYTTLIPFFFGKQQ